VLTTASEFSILTKTGALNRGSMVTGFGDISVASDISTTSGGTITAGGLLAGNLACLLGSVPDHTVTIRGTIEVRGGAATVFSISPMNGERAFPVPTLAVYP
jgi:hypothetical protein